MQDRSNSTIGSLMTEMKDPNNNFKRFEFDIQISKTVKNNPQLENTERQCWANAQYLRRECWVVFLYQKQLSQRIWNKLFVKFLIVLVLTLTRTE